MSNIDNRNAFIGRNVEILFRNSIGDHPELIEKIRSLYGVKGRYLNSVNTGIHSEKVDVKMEFACGHNIDANVKAYKASSASYNQLTRTSIANFCRTFDLGIKVQRLFETLFVNKARKKSECTFPQEVREEINGILQPIAANILKWAFSHKQGREILVVFERDASIMRVYSMKDVFKKLKKQVTFTARGNVMIGGCVVLQRKGGNGVHSKDIPKDSLKHPGNNVQIKLRMREFVTEMENNEIGSYRI